MFYPFQLLIAFGAVLFSMEFDVSKNPKFRLCYKSVNPEIALSLLTAVKTEKVCLDIAKLT